MISVRGRTVRQWFGVELDEVSGKEKAVSMLGGAIAIFLVIVISRDALGASGAPMLIASMGASAVLLFAVPHGQLSQPWPVLAGHVGSALIGVTCGRLFTSSAVAAACAVGVAIGVMHQLKCIHPPGGATALTAVIGGRAVTSLGYGFVLRPVLVNALCIVAVAIVFNCLFPWRRYPAVLNRRPKGMGSGEPPAGGGGAGELPWRELTHDEIRAAVRTLDSFIDVTEADLARLHQLLSRRQA